MATVLCLLHPLLWLSEQRGQRKPWKSRTEAEGSLGTLAGLLEGLDAAS